MTRTMLRGIRVASKQEPIDRIHRYFEEISADPVVFRWKYKMDETLKTWRRYCSRDNRLLTRAAPYGSDSEPRTSESGCAITYDVLFSRSTRKAWVEAGHPKSKGYGTACTATSDTRAFNPALSAIARSKTALAMDGSVYVTASSISAHSPSLAREPGSIRSSPRLFMIVTSSKGTGRGI